ncbi:MAG: hypothetical protein IM574_01570 [Cytophagales bacterium]|jgi:hypothetical protein|nr:hypothetical protein [Cytophagales bacterium]MCA6387565.1 hypothetical protein [Cytophagales bacterium]MCA6390316.1 hypothetical protein [Cytophagales bacterium]MCA6399350.1 hypothetical protein [Cytophagales bacterium]MCA6400628.1 hypothetical protein [Cytophagales bacterium]
MKTLRKNIDLSNETIAILQIEATLSSFGSLKPFLEKIVNDFAAKSSKGRPEVYSKVLSTKKSNLSHKKLFGGKRKKLKG